MRIDAYNQISQLYRTDTATVRRDMKKTSTRDQYQMSETGRTYQIMKKAVQDAPDIRAEKIADLKSRIDAGTYQVSSEAFAEKMLADYEIFA